MLRNQREVKHVPPQPSLWEACDFECISQLRVICAYREIQLCLKKTETWSFKPTRGTRGNFPEQVTILGHLKDMIGTGKMGQEEREGRRESSEQRLGNQ